MNILLLALLIGIIAGLRAFTAPTVVSWAARLGWITLAGTPLAFLASPITVGILTVAAIGEIVNDKRASTPSRKIPPQFGARILMGGFSGAALGLSHGASPSSWLGGLVAGILGAILGTLGGSAVRGALARAFGKDLPAALIEDCIAVGGGLLIVCLAS